MKSSDNDTDNHEVIRLLEDQLALTQKELVDAKLEIEEDIGALRVWRGRTYRAEDRCAELEKILNTVRTILEDTLTYHAYDPEAHVRAVRAAHMFLTSERETNATKE